MGLKNYKLILVLSAVLAGCNKQPVEQAAVEIAVDTKTPCDNADDFFDSYSYVVLDTDPAALIGEINNIDIDDDNIVINSRNDVFVFDRKGHLVSSFNNTGQGPEEYAEVFDMRLNDGVIYILSRSTMEVKTYSLSGEYVDSYKLPYYYSAMEIADGSIWLASETANESLYEFAEYSTDKREVVRNVMPFEKNESFLYSSFYPFLMQDDDKLYVSRLYDMNVSTIDCESGDVAEKWKFKFNTEKQLSDFDREQGYAYMYSATANKPVVTYLGRMAENDGSVYLSFNNFFIIGYFTNLYKFNKEHPEEGGKLLSIGLASYEGFPFLKSKPLLFHDNCYVSMLVAEHVISIAESLKIDDFNDAHLTEESNPVLFFHRLK